MALDFASMTLTEFLAAAEKVESALRTLREAGALMGGTPAPSPVAARTAVQPPVTLVDPDKQAAIDEWRNNPQRAKLLANMRGEADD